MGSINLDSNFPPLGAKPESTEPRCGGTGMDMRGMETRPSGRNWGRPGQWPPAMVVWQCSWRDRRRQEALVGPSGTSWGDLRLDGE